MSLEELKREVPARTETQIVCRCSFCKKMANEYGGLYVNKWPTESYGVAETSIVMRTGHAWPDSSSTVEESVEVCVDCFREKVKPALEALGIKFTVRECEW